MKIDVLLGLQWGDEGKGKIVDVLTPEYDIVARFQGGANAGHTLIFDNKKYVLHLIPSGVFRKNIINVIGSGVVLDPTIFAEEIKGLQASGIDLTERLLIAEKANLILPTHRMLDALNEQRKGKEKIGSTLKGIGPAYTDKTARTGLKVFQLNNPDFKEQYLALKQHHLKLLEHFETEVDFDLERAEKEWFEGIELLKRYTFINSEHFFNTALSENKKILAEGAQGSLLDIDFGTYPFVTSSTTTASGVCHGLGIAPGKVGEVLGVCKAYITRVGSGPFPTELHDETGDYLKEKGHEVGATTGRDRRCGWLDLPALKYACQINGVTKLILTKADVLSGLKTIKFAEKYKQNGTVIDYFPTQITNTEAVYSELAGWSEDITEIKAAEELPENLKAYIAMIEKYTGVSVYLLSTGADRKNCIKM